MESRYQKRILAGFCLAFILLCSVAIAVYSSFVQMNHEKERVDHTYEVMSTLQSIISDLKDVQSSVRGYTITGMQNYLTPYFVALPKISENLDRLEVLVQDNPAQMKRYTGLKDHVEERLSVADSVVDLYKSQGQTAAFDMIKGGTGKNTMDEIRVNISDMMSEEHNLLNARRMAVENSTKLTMFAGTVGLIICLITLVLVFAQVNREARLRAKTEESLRLAVVDMERNNNETKLIGNLGDYLRGCLNEDEAYQIIRSNMPILFPDTFGSVSLFKNSRNALIQATMWGEIPANVQTEFEPDDCWSLRQGRMHHSKKDGSTPVCRHLILEEKNASFVCLPMQAQGETSGQILIGTKTLREFTSHELATMRAVGEQISLALANLSLQRILKEQSIKDPLTKLFNRRYLEETLERECIRAKRNNQPLCVLMMDIDHFKKVNDTYGHDAGDAVLVSFAQVLSRSVRKDDVACRMGGEEFVAVLPTASIEHAIVRAQEINDAIRKMKVVFKGQSIPVTVSVGIAQYPDHGDVKEELMANADAALYKAKQTGRDKYIVFDPAVPAA